MAILDFGWLADMKRRGSQQKEEKNLTQKLVALSMLCILTCLFLTRCNCFWRACVYFLFYSVRFRARDECQGKYNCVIDLSIAWKNVSINNNNNQIFAKHELARHARRADYRNKWSSLMTHIEVSFVQND